MGNNFGCKYKDSSPGKGFAFEADGKPVIVVARLMGDDVEPRRRIYSLKRMPLQVAHLDA